jgi:hypothetical protein
LIIYPVGLKYVFLDNGTKFQPPCTETYRAEVCMFFMFVHLRNFQSCKAVWAAGLASW